MFSCSSIFWNHWQSQSHKEPPAPAAASAAVTVPDRDQAESDNRRAVSAICVPIDNKNDILLQFGKRFLQPHGKGTLRTASSSPMEPTLP